MAKQTEGSKIMKAAKKLIEKSLPDYIVKYDVPGEPNFSVTNINPDEECEDEECGLISIHLILNINSESVNVCTVEKTMYVNKQPCNYMKDYTVDYRNVRSLLDTIILTSELCDSTLVFN